MHLSSTTAAYPPPLPEPVEGSTQVTFDECTAAPSDLCKCFMCLNIIDKAADIYIINP